MALCIASPLEITLSSFPLSALGAKCRTAVIYNLMSTKKPWVGPRSSRCHLYEDYWNALNWSSQEHLE